MIKTMVKMFSMVCLATIVAGFGYAHMKALNEYDIMVFHDRLRAKEAVETVLEHYYDKDEVRDWATFRYENLERNKALFANGRVPKPNDLICIEVHRKKK